MIKTERQPGEQVIILARQLKCLDDFFAFFSNNKEIIKFLEENRIAVYTEISHRLQFGVKNESFGSFESLVLQAMDFVVSHQAGENNDESVFSILKRRKNATETVIEIAKIHGLDWVPLEFKRKVAYSVLALPLQFILFESLRISVITSLHSMNLEQFSSFILGVYGLISVIGFIQEQRTLKTNDTIVLNPYGNLLSLGLTPILAGTLSRGPRHLFEISTIISAMLTNGEFNSVILRTVLSAVVAISLWSIGDIAFNLIQQKNQEIKSIELINLDIWCNLDQDSL